MTQAHALIIDDNPQNVRILAQLLLKQTVTSTQVTNPNELAQVIAKLSGVDVTFLDLEMPGSDAFKIKKLLKTTFPAAPVIAYTVHLNEINAVRQAGFDGFLGKPLNTTQFPDYLARILRGEAVWERT